MLFTEHILKAYSAQWWPPGNEATIPSSDDAWTLIHDPTTIRAKGRPKSTRIRNEMDWLESSEHQKKCSRCGAEGHNKRRCSMQSDHGSCSFNCLWACRPRSTKYFRHLLYVDFTNVVMGMLRQFFNTLFTHSERLIVMWPYLCPSLSIRVAMTGLNWWNFSKFWSNVCL